MSRGQYSNQNRPDLPSPRPLLPPLIEVWKGITKPAERHNLSILSQVCPGVSSWVVMPEIQAASWPDAWTTWTGFFQCRGEVALFWAAPRDDWVPHPSSEVEARNPRRKLISDICLSLLTFVGSLFRSLAAIRGHRWMQKVRALHKHKDWLDRLPLG